MTDWKKRKQREAEDGATGRKGLGGDKGKSDLANARFKQFLFGNSAYTKDTCTQASGLEINLILSL
jgi:hypothetical protein